MTLENTTQTVRLSLRDWIALAGVLLTVAGMLFGAYLHHDRTLTEITTQQQATNHRLDKIEARLERTHP